MNAREQQLQNSIKPTIAGEACVSASPFFSFYNSDCMRIMAQYPDKYFDLAIVDPPYGIDINNQSQGKGGGVAKKIDYAKKDWDKNAGSF